MKSLLLTLLLVNASLSNGASSEGEKHVVKTNSINADFVDLLVSNPRPNPSSRPDEMTNDLPDDFPEELFQNSQQFTQGNFTSTDHADHASDLTEVLFQGPTPASPKIEAPTANNTQNTQQEETDPLAAREQLFGLLSSTVDPAQLNSESGKISLFDMKLQIAAAIFSTFSYQQMNNLHLDHQVLESEMREVFKMTSQLISFTNAKEMSPFLVNPSVHYIEQALYAMAITSGIKNSRPQSLSSADGGNPNAPSALEIIQSALLKDFKGQELTLFENIVVIENNRQTAEFILQARMNALLAVATTSLTNIQGKTILDWKNASIEAIRASADRDLSEQHQNSYDTNFIEINHVQFDFITSTSLEQKVLINSILTQVLDTAQFLEKINISPKIERNFLKRIYKNFHPDSENIVKAKILEKNRAQNELLFAHKKGKKVYSTYFYSIEDHRLDLQEIKITAKIYRNIRDILNSTRQ